MSIHEEATDTVNDEPLRRQSIHNKLSHLGSRHNSSDESRYSGYLTPRNQRISRNDRRRSTIDSTDSTGGPSKTAGVSASHPRPDPSARASDTKKTRLAPLWPEWNEAEINAESWDIGSGKKKDAGGGKARADVKSANSATTHGFDDPEGKIELPSSFRIDQWKRPAEFLPPERTPVIVDTDVGLQNFDLVRPNEHLHYNETMRNIISQITALWDICRRERKATGAGSSDNAGETNMAVLNGRTWRPWEHIYALNKVSRQPFITPYNPTGKYVIRLFFLGTWRKIIVDDMIPFDMKGRCLLPQTALSYELWPMLLSKALLKIINLDIRSNNNLEYNETSVIHCLTGWIPEPIPLKYTHAKKVWEFLRYDRSNKMITDLDIERHKNEQPTTPNTAVGPIPLFKWPDQKSDLPDESLSIIDPSAHHDDNATESFTKKSDDRSPKKGGAATSLSVPKESSIGGKGPTGKESRAGAGPTAGTGKDAKKLGGAARGVTTDDSSGFVDDQTIPEAPKMIVFATIPHVPPTRNSSYSETADRSERLRRYNLNETFSTSMLLTTIRDIPLEPPPPPEYVPAWKLIRPKKPKVLPHAEPMLSQEVKPERWVEIASPYINYPSATSLSVNHHPSGHIPHSRLSRSATHSTVGDVPDIVEVDEEGDIENIEVRPENDADQKLNTLEQNDGLDESLHDSGSRMRRERSADKSRSNRRLAGSKLDLTGTKAPSDIVSIKSKGPDSEPHATPLDVHTPGNILEHQESQSKSNQEANSNLGNSRIMKKPYAMPKIWMDFDDFCSCFTNVIVFHNPRGYQCVQKHTEIKFFAPQQPSVALLTKEKKKDTNAPVPPQLPNLQDDKSPLYLFVDSPKENCTSQIELLISLSSLSRWYELPSNETALPFQSTGDKTARTGGASNEKASADVSPARGLLGRQRTSTVETLPQTPASNAGQQDGSQFDGSQKDANWQSGALIAEVFSWKSLSMGQPILRIHSTSTKASFLKLPPGRHVLKFTVACPIAYHLQIMSDSHDFTLGDEDHLFSKVISVQEDAEFSVRAEELFNAFDDAVQNFHSPELQNKRLNDLFHVYCENAPLSSNLTIQSCWKAFNEALYATLKANFSGSTTVMTADTQFAWRCFTNDLTTPDIIGAYEARRPSTSGASRNSARTGGPVTAGNVTNPPGTATGKKGAGGKEKVVEDKAQSKQAAQAGTSATVSDTQDEPVSEWLTRELLMNEINAIVSIQKFARGFLQRRVILTRTPGSEKNLQAQQALINSMNVLKADISKAAGLLFRNLMISKPILIQCFQFRKDDWNMVNYRDYLGQYADQPSNTWFVLLREIFYATEECFLSAKLLTHSSNSVLRVLNNDTYEEMPLIFNRLAPSSISKNKSGYTLFAESLTTDQPLSAGRFRLRLLTSYAHLPEPRVDPITSTFFTREIKDYYLPNRQNIICRYRVTVSDDLSQSGRNYHLASIQFNTSKPDVLMRLSIFDNNEEVVNVEGKGSVVLPAFLFMRDVIAGQAANNHGATNGQPTSRPTSKTGGSNKKDSSKAAASNTTHRGSIVESTALGSGRSDREKVGSGKRSRSSSRTGVMIDEEEKSHKYIVQVTLLRKSWPLTPTQWAFVEQLKEQERQELRIFNRQPSAGKTDGQSGTTAAGAGGKRTGQSNPTQPVTTAKGKGQSSTATSNKGGSVNTGRPGTGKGNLDKTIDASKAYWVLRVVSDADKTDEITVRKDTERNDELINMKKAWETHEAGRSQKALKSRQKFLDSLQPKLEETAGQDSTGKSADGRPNDDNSIGSATTHTTGTGDQHQTVVQPSAPSKTTSSTAPKKSASSTGNKKGSNKDDSSKQVDHSTTPQDLHPPVPVIDEPLLYEPPETKPKIALPPLDVKSFMKQKLLGDEMVVLDQIFEQEEMQRRQADFREFTKYAEEIRHCRDEDHSNRYKEKIRQLEEYVDLQARIDKARRTINEPREAFRQRFLEIERKRLAELAAQEQELLAAAEKAKAAAPTKGKGSAGKKGKK